METEARLKTRTRQPISAVVTRRAAALTLSALVLCAPAVTLVRSAAVAAGATPVPPAAVAAGATLPLGPSHLAETGPPAPCNPGSR